MSGGVYGGDEVGAVCLDMGSHSVRAGFAGEDAPKANIPTHMLSVEKDGQRKYHVGTSALSFPREKAEVVNPLKDGMVENWEQCEAMLDYVYNKCLNVSSAEHPVMMSEVAWNKVEKRQKMTEIMFEKYNIPAFFLCKNAVLAAFAAGRSTALILDSGYNQTTAIPVHDGYVLQQGIVKSPLAGNFLAAQMRESLKRQGVDIVPIYQIAAKESVKEGQAPKWTPRKNIPNVTKSYHNYCVDSQLEDVMQGTLQIHDNPFNEVELAMIPSTSYDFPNGYIGTFGVDRFRIPEPLFDPLGNNIKILGGDLMAMHQVLAQSISMCDVDVRPNLYSNIVLAGGTTLVQGFSDRLHMECQAKTASSMKVKVVTGGNSSDRIFSTWVGSSILASLGNFQELWVSKQEYEEEGKGIIDRKCP